jgi:FAD/FMN-containing dehydrogenase/Fe-S oxidoreductase
VEDVRIAVQILAEHHVPLVPRGGGTSLSGQAVGPGVVIDCSKYLRQIVEMDVTARRVRVQPGVVLEQLNRALAPHGLMFGPDVSTASRACLGGMIGNNSAGSHSIVYGKTVDHVRALDIVHADGTMAKLKEQSLAEVRGKTGLSGVVAELVQMHHLEIRRRFPRILRRVSGYNLDTLLDQYEAGSLNLASLLVGSEGTLAFVTEAELNLVPRPQYRGLLVPHFVSLSAALESLALCLEPGPSAVELVDQMILDLARENLALQRRMQPIQGRPAAIFMVEFTGDEEAQIQDKLEKLARKLERAPGVTTVVRVRPEDREPLWRLRESGLPLLMGLPGDRKPVTFVEDCAVAPEKLPEFTARFQEIIRRHHTFGAFYGHASVGCLHIRPVLNLKEVADVATMRQISAAVSDLVLEFGGSLSGEHGDGLARSMWLRKMFGEEIYDAFRQIKRAFDPENLFNPGKIVDAPEMTENLRYGSDYHPTEPATLLDFSGHGGLVRHVELCSGTGVCRRLNEGVMCPSYRATREEKDSTRGRANALRLALTGKEPLKELRSEWVADVLDLCLACKACKAECPSNVDMAALKAEVGHQRYQQRPRPVSDWLMGHVHQAYRYGAPLAGLANWLGQRRLVRWFLDRFGGIDRRRSLPPLHRRHFRRWFRKHRPPSYAGRAGKVLLLDDCFTTYNEPHLGKAAVWLLEKAGYAVELADIPCCGRTLISKGFLRHAQELVATTAPRLAASLGDGVPLLGIEPSCLLSFVDEWPRLVPGPDTQQLAQAAVLADGWLAQRLPQHGDDLKFKSQPGQCLVHGHCHQKALVGMTGTQAALGLIPELDVKLLDTGCCGMAGSFGYEKQHYDLSVSIAEVSVLPRIQEQPEALLVATGTSCRHQILDLTGRKAWHPLELLAECGEP